MYILSSAVISYVWKCLHMYVHCTITDRPAATTTNYSVKFEKKKRLTKIALINLWIFVNSKSSLGKRVLWNVEIMCDLEEMSQDCFIFLMCSHAWMWFTARLGRFNLRCWIKWIQGKSNWVLCAFQLQIVLLGIGYTDWEFCD